jgi:hypothetical protein
MVETMSIRYSPTLGEVLTGHKPKEYKKMKVNSKSMLHLSPLAIFLIALGLAPFANSAEITAKDATLNINGQLQLHGALEIVDDPYKDDNRLFLFLRQARLSVNGEYKQAKYEVEWMMGGEEVPENNTVMSLLDAYFDTPLNETVRVKLGQFKVPYSRERLLDSGNSFNVNRSVGNNYFNIGRDVGMAIYTEGDQFSGALGLFTGGGINIPERYLPEDIGIPMFVARFGINNGLDQDVFTPVGADSDKDNAGFAAYLNAMYNEDSRVGHSTPLNVKTYDKSLMLRSDWNPFVSAFGEKSEFYQFGADVAWQGALSENAALLLTAEANFSHFSNDRGSLENVGGLIAAHVIMDEWSYGIRYGVVDPDSGMVYTESIDPVTPGGRPTEKRHPITDEMIHEISPSIVYFMKDRGIKIIAEVSYQMDVPVGVENKHGVYNLMRQPGQVKQATSAGIELQDNYIANLIVQYNF